MMTKDEQVIQIIDAFTKFCPESRYSFGHIVLDDYNLTNGNIEFCLEDETIEEWFSFASSDPTWERFQHDDLVTMRNIIEAFLRFLLAIPEDERADWEED